MEASLLAQFDQLVAQRHTSRSELLRDLAREEIIKSLATQRVDAFASVTVVYDHGVRELSERITEMQHDLGEQVRSTMHVHLDADRCLEVIVMRGRADKLRHAAERLFATRGVLQGSIEIVADTSGDEQVHDHVHGHSHEDARESRPARAGRAQARRGGG
jgi:CopG family nickel-responsive transcriptional regulator